MKRLLIATAVIVNVFGLRTGFHDGAAAERPPEAPAAAKLDWNVPNRPLSRTLADLAKAQGMNPQDFLQYGQTGDVGSVSTIEVAGKTYAIAVQSMAPWGVPGISAQQVVLLSPKGQILDRLECEINSRYGLTKTEVLQNREADGARVVVRFVPQFPRGHQNWWHNWHKITFHGKFYRFWEKPHDEPGIWDEKGLCRAKVADGKLVVLFPKLELPDLTAARSLRIGYPVQGKTRHLAIDDTKEVRNMLSALTIAGRDQDHFGGEHSDLTVDFVMPNGTKVETAFAGRSMLLDKKQWGGIDLGSLEFYTKVTAAISKAEGRTIDLIPEKR